MGERARIKKDDREMIRVNRLVLAAGLVCAATVLAAEPSGNSVRSDTEFESNFKGPDVDPVTRNPRFSNWPGLPERQAGRSYSKLINTTSGVRERNAESGRR